jgi:hypothetical protein
MALVVTRKNPELAEMAYRYGGMVRWSEVLYQNPYRWFLEA